MSSGIIGPDPAHAQISDYTRRIIAESLLKQLDDAVLASDRETALALILQLLDWCDPVFLAALDTAYKLNTLRAKDRA